MNKPLFNLDSVAATSKVAEVLDGKTINDLVTRHLMGDWGNICEEDKESNRQAIKEDYRILSCYDLKQYGYEDLERVYIITEADRSYTTLMFVSEY